MLLYNKGEGVGIRKVAARQLHWKTTTVAWVCLGFYAPSWLKDINVKYM